MQRLEQKGVNSSERGFLQMGQGRRVLFMGKYLGMGRFERNAGINFDPQLLTGPPRQFVEPFRLELRFEHGMHRQKEDGPCPLGALGAT